MSIFYVVCIIIVILVLIVMANSRCPICKSYDSEEFTRYGEPFTRYEDVLRTNKHFDNRGAQTGHSEYYEQVLVTRRKKATWSKCKKCGHEFVYHVTIE